MAQTANKVPAKSEEKTAQTPSEWSGLGNLRREVDRLFDEFGTALPNFPFRHTAFENEPFWRRGFHFGATPKVDIVEKDNRYEITAELPGIDEKNIEISLSDNVLTIKGEKQEEAEEKKKDYVLSERRYGVFQRSFAVPNGIDVDTVEARFNKGVLTITLPKSPEAQKKEKKVEIKTN